MYKIKENPEDFVVKERLNLIYDKKGNYSYYLLRKRDYTTEKAIGLLAREFKFPLKYFNYAGTKDRRAITEQYVSISKGPERNVDLNDIQLEFLGKGVQRINLGTLKGNNFEIIVRNIEKGPKELGKFVNYFGEQRFGMNKNNHVVGKFLIKKEFQKALEELGKENINYASELRKIPKKILRMFVHAYQSHLWNKIASIYIKEYKEEKNIKIPLIGFGTELRQNKLGKIIIKLLEKEKINTRDFIIRELPELSSEGDKRHLYSKIMKLDIGNLEDDELNKGKKKIKIGFYLQKGCYGTEAVKAMFL